MLIDELGVPVAPQQYAKIIKLCDDALQFDAINEENRKRYLLLTDMIQKCILKILSAVSHLSYYPVSRRTRPRHPPCLMFPSSNGSSDTNKHMIARVRCEPPKCLSLTNAPKSFRFRQP